MSAIGRRCRKFDGRIYGLECIDSVELIAQGSRVIVPCLRIGEGVEVKWFYESNDIIQFLNTRFG